MTSSDTQLTNGHTTSTPVLIVGAGPVGLLLALRLGQAHINAWVIEKEDSTSELPRAVGYYAASQEALYKAKVYDKIRQQGFMSAGICWRKPTVADGTGKKKLGSVIACQGMGGDDETDYPVGTGLLNLPQAALSKLLLQEVLSTGRVKVQFNQELCSIEENGEVVTITKRDTISGVETQQVGCFLVGADGARSKTRSLLQLGFPGHTWPEKVLATDVWIQNYEEIKYPTQFILDRTHFVVMTPLSKPVVGETTHWRVAMGLNPQDERSDEEISHHDEIQGLYERILPGPRPLSFKVSRSTVYKIHQRLAPTFRRGRVVLAGDAAHICNPIGAMGLNTGILDADALAETLIMILNESKPDSLLDIYSDERRKVFQRFVDPVSTYNKLRLHTVDAETANQDDWFYRLMQNPSRDLMKEMNKPFYEMWPTDMRKLAHQAGL